MDQIAKMFDSIPNDKIKQYNQWATIVSGVADLSTVGMFKGKIPMDQRQLKKIAQWASLIAMVTEFVIKYRGI